MNKVIKPLMCFWMLLLFNISMSASAAIFKCVNVEGKTYYIDRSCPEDNKETELQAVKDPINGYIPPDFVPDEIIEQKPGVVVGEASEGAESIKNRNDASDGVSIGGGGKNQSTGKNSQGEVTATAEQDIASQRTESDIIFNSKLNAESKTSGKDFSNTPLNSKRLESSAD